MKIQPLRNAVVNCRTEEQAKIVMIILELNGWRMFGGGN